MRERARGAARRLAEPRSLAWALRWLWAPLVAGALVSSAVDLAALPVIGRPQLSAVVLIDGQAYFGRLEDVGWSDVLVMREPYYLQEAGKAAGDLSVALVQRGGEVHLPVVEMRIRRDKVLLVERVGPDSPVARAIATQRSFDRMPQPR